MGLLSMGRGSVSRGQWVSDSWHFQTSGSVFIEGGDGQRIPKSSSSSKFPWILISHLFSCHVSRSLVLK